MSNNGSTKPLNLIVPSYSNADNSLQSFLIKFSLINSLISSKSLALLGQNEHFLLHTPDSLISTSVGSGYLPPLYSINFILFSTVFFIA